MEGVWAWGMSSFKYVQDSVRNVEKAVKGCSMMYMLHRASKAKHHFPSYYEPDVDVSSVLDAGMESFTSPLLGWPDG